MLPAFQAAVAKVDLLLRIPVEVTALHTATAAALVLTTAVCVRAVWLRPLGAIAAAPAHEPAGSRG